MVANFMVAFIPMLPGFAFIIIGYMIQGAEDTTAPHEVGVAAGIYWDQASGLSTADHNVLWNNYQCDFHIQQNGLPKRHAGKSGFTITRLLRIWEMVILAHDLI